MKHLFVDFAIAKYAKEKGFNEVCAGYFDYNNELQLSIGVPTNSAVIKAPTHQQLLDWLREKKILVEVRPIDSWNCWSCAISMEDSMSPFFEAARSTIEYRTYYEALNEGIKQAIILI